MNYRRIDHQQELQRFQREIDQLRDQNAAMEIQVNDRPYNFMKTCLYAMSEALS